MKIIIQNRITDEFHINHMMKIKTLNNLMTMTILPNQILTKQKKKKFTAHKLITIFRIRGSYKGSLES